MQWSDLLSKPKPAATRRIPYGPLPQQVVDLWLPDGPGRHPLVLMIHGGCWTKSIADLTIMNYAAEDLRKRGVAVWNIEYRGVDEPGGGYPGTYLDVAAALDAARGAARTYDLDVSRGVIVGHSAGGHLALWAAARHKLPKSSLLHTAAPVRINAVVDLARPRQPEDRHRHCLRRRARRRHGGRAVRDAPPISTPTPPPPPWSLSARFST